MSSGVKRPLGSTDRSISPPALRRKIPRSPNGDQHVGNTWSSKANAGQVRIFSWNVNGAGPLLQKTLSFETSSLTPLRAFLKRHQWPDLLCLQEVKISPKDPATQRQLQHAANQGQVGDEPTYNLELSLPRDKYNATGFGGKVHGVASLLRHDFACRTRRPDWDLEGRVLIHEHETGTVVINGYWVNGTNNPYRDTTTGQITGTRHDHKLRFHANMLEETRNYELKGQHVVLVGDMNIAPAEVDGHPHLRTSPVQHVKNRADFNSRFFSDETGMRGIDVFRHIHGKKRKYTYHPRGIVWGSSCDRVDLIVVSRTLVGDLGAVLGADICDSSAERGHSDHVPLWVSLDLSKLREKNDQSPVRQQLSVTRQQSERGSGSDEQ
jgi:exonuclease III